MLFAAITSKRPAKAGGERVSACLRVIKWYASRKASDAGGGRRKREGEVTNEDRTIKIS